MKIQSVHLHRYRGVESAHLLDCAGLNILIGRNNAGKSTFLAAIELALEKISSGQLVAEWRARRPQDDFFNHIATLTRTMLRPLGKNADIQSNMTFVILFANTTRKIRLDEPPKT